MKLFGAGAFLIRIACPLVPLGMLAGLMLRFIGMWWGLGTVIVVSVPFCLYWQFLTHRIGDDDAAGGMSLPVQQPAPGTSSACAVGLGASTIAALPAYSYEKKAGGSDECVVCLGKLQRGELVKRLPACAHLFHEGCIDAWLRSNGTCPVCRWPVDAAPPVSAGIPPPTE